MKFSAPLLLFVALLLPFRGAMAVTGMLCHSGLEPLTTLTAVQHSHGEHDGAGHEHAGHGANQHADHDSGTSNDHTASCNLCSSICGAPPLPSAGVALHDLLPPGAERFPATASPHAWFALSGPERPPRSI